jgi:hypothetical protein
MPIGLSTLASSTKRDLILGEQGDSLHAHSQERVARCVRDFRLEIYVTVKNPNIELSCGAQ